MQGRECVNIPSDIRIKPAGRRLPRRAPRRAAGATPGLPDDRFYRHIIDSLRSGLIAVRASGALALMNDEAYRILALRRRPDDIGRPFSDILRARPEVMAALSTAFETSRLSNRAELRLKDIGRFIGYTLSQVATTTAASSAP
jgi:hypothetical protein